MSTSVGAIHLDLGLDNKKFNAQLSDIKNKANSAGIGISKSFDSVKSSLGGLGTMMVAAFSIKAIVGFTSSCLKLGSDLTEVQNVVDVTFTSMSGKVNKFAKDAVMSFGLSETMAKQFVGTTGAMAKAFGFNEKAALDMGTAIAGMAGDIASFYNITQDEAFTKLKSIFTGETESLKSLGVVMTQSALDSFALANGFGKTTKAMTEQEKVALRYKFVMNQLQGASGDFARTSDGWANQIRILKLQFESLKASIGQGLITVLSPVIKTINIIIGKILSLANAFKSFSSLISGNKGSDSISGSAKNMSNMATASADAGKALGGAGNAAKKAAKDIASATTGLDELNIISKPEEGGDSGSGAGGGSGSGYQADNFDMGELEKGEDELSSFEKSLLPIIERFKELKNIFAQGFEIGFGDSEEKIKNIKESIGGINSVLREAATDKKVVASFNNMLDDFALAAGKVSGSMVSIGLSISENLIGGIELYLKNNSKKIKNFLASFFDIQSEKAEIVGDFYVVLAEISNVFGSDEAKSITSSVIEIFSNSFLDIILLSEKFGRDVLNIITAPFIDNKDLLKESLQGIINALEPIFNSIADIVTYIGESMNTTYDTHIRPMMKSFANGFSEIVKVLLNAWNTYIKPIIEDFGKRFSEISEDAVKPLIDRINTFVSKLADGIKEVWETILKPFISWLIEFMAPIFAEVFSGFIDIGLNFLENIIDVVGSVLDSLGGLIDFIAGVFTGDWQRAWEGIKTFVKGIWDIILGIVKTVFNLVYDAIKSYLGKIKAVWDSIWKKIKEFITEVWNNIKTLISNTVENIRVGIDKFLVGIKTSWKNIWDNIKTTTKDIWDGIWNIIKGVINSIIGGIENMVNSSISAINSLIEGINDIADKIPGMSSDLIPTLPRVNLPRLAQGGFVKANTPQLAIIGDNKYQGEVVAPENKMIDMARIAAELASNKNDGAGNIAIVEILQRILELIENYDPTIVFDVRELTEKQKDLNKRLGYTMT